MRLESTTGECLRFQADFSDFLDERLSSVRAAEMRAHVDNCERCLRHLAAYRRGVVIYRSIEPVDVSTDFYERLEARLWQEARSSDRAIEVVAPDHPVVGMVVAAVFAFALFWTGWEAGRAVAPPVDVGGARPVAASVAVQPGTNGQVAPVIDLTEWTVQVALAVP